MRVNWIAFGFAALFAAGAYGQARTFVSGNGIDAGSCSRSAPCRNLVAAVAAVAPGGEVIILDSAGYGPVTITKSLSIIAPAGVYAGITAPSGSAVTIAASTGTVVLRGLTLNATGALLGIWVQSASAVHVENCAIRGFGTHGVLAAAGRIFISDSVFSENSVDGVGIIPAAANTVTGTIDHCRLVNNTRGVGVFGNETLAGTEITVSNSVLSNNDTGIEAGYAFVNVKECVLAKNNYGISSMTTAGITVSNTMLINTTHHAFHNGGGTFVSFGNNQLFWNAVDKDGPITNVNQQ